MHPTTTLTTAMMTSHKLIQWRWIMSGYIILFLILFVSFFFCSFSLTYSFSFRWVPFSSFADLPVHSLQSIHLILMPAQLFRKKIMQHVNQSSFFLYFLQHFVRYIQATRNALFLISMINVNWNVCFYDLRFHSFVASLFTEKKKPFFHSGWFFVLSHSFTINFVRFLFSRAHFFFLCHFNPEFHARDIKIK